MPWIVYVQIARQPPDVIAPEFRHVHRCDDFLQPVFVEQVVYFFYRVHFMLSLLSRQPNKSPEPTVVGACDYSLSSWLLFGLVPRWLSFLR